MKPKFFKTQSDLRKWFEKYSDKESELIVGFYKVGSGKPSITWPQSVDEAICFGWIDGIRKSIDKQSYTVRFTPRRPKSIWSTVNINKAEKMIKHGLMKPEGLEAFRKKNDSNSKIYSYEQATLKLDKKFEKLLKANKKAWKNYQLQPPSYKKAVVRWLNSAKQEQTKLKRLNELIKDSEQNQRIKPLRRNK